MPTPEEPLPTFEELADGASGALDRLYELPLHFSPSPIHRDAAIHRFRVAFEILWRACQRFLVEREGLDMAAPQGVIRAAGSIGVLPGDDARLALEMAEDRNLTGHTYDDENAVAIYRRLEGHGALMRRWLQSMRERAASEAAAAGDD